MTFILALVASLLSFILLGNRALAQYKLPLVVGGLVFLGVAFSQTISVVPAGSVGVVDFFGKVSPLTLKAGVNIRNPLAKIVLFTIKTQQTQEIMQVPSKEGLNVQLDASLLFHLDPDKVFEIYKSVGRNYIEIILNPQFRSVTRGVTSQYDAKALYTSKREELADKIMAELTLAVGDRGIVIEAVPLRQIKLPARLSASIEEKLQAEQESQRMQFVLAKEKQEADRKRIEAQGIADFQEIVTEGINDNLLRWKGIEATENLAKSTNSKMVIIGGKDGMPLILNQ